MNKLKKIKFLIAGWNLHMCPFCGHQDVSYPNKHNNTHRYCDECNKSVDDFDYLIKIMNLFNYFPKGSQGQQRYIDKHKKKFFKKK